MSHAAVKSFDRHGISCKNVRTVQFSGGVEKCPVTRKTALPTSALDPLAEVETDKHADLCLRLEWNAVVSDRGRYIC